MKLLKSALFLTLSLFPATAAVYAVEEPAPAKCAICIDTPCFDRSGCFEGCACLKRFPEPMGHCVSLD